MILDEMTRYRVKAEKDGKTLIDLPGILCLPGLLAAPKMSILGMVSAPLFGVNVHLEDGSGKEVDVSSAVRKAAETATESMQTAAKTVKEEIDRAWQEMSEEKENSEEKAETPEESRPSNEEILEDLKKHEESDIPTIQVNPDEE